MKLIQNYHLFLILLILSFTTEFQLLSQDLTSYLSKQFSKQDQYKILKAIRFEKQGKSLIYDISGDAVILKDTIHYNENEAKLSSYYSKRIRASYYIKNANGLYFMIFHKHIKKFWHNYLNPKEPLDIYFRYENAAYDSLVKADKMRANAENSIYVDDKISLVTTAEHIEEDALIQLEKVLYVYILFPQKPDLAWLYSGSKNIPEIKVIAQLKSIPVDKDSLSHNKININSSRIDSLQIENIQNADFKEFAETPKNNKLASNNLNYQQIYSEAIDSVHLDWHKYLSNEEYEKIPNDSINKESIIVEKIPPTDSYYTIQIAACKVPVTSRELKKLWQGALPVKESVEDNWHKYTIGSFNSYEEASTLLSSLQPVKYFIAVYQKQKRTKIIMR